MLESKSLFVKDETGKEVEMEILFTFDDDQKNKKYVVFTNPADDNDEVFASCYDEEGNLLPIDTDEEWAMVEEVLGAFGEDDGQE